MSVIMHNILAMNADRQFGINTKNKAKNTEKLASGYKINRSADDAAGLSISEKMRNQIRNLNQGISNTEDAIHMCKVGDGALNEVDNIIHRMKELSVHSANEILDDDDRKALDEEYQLLKEEINKIGNDTQFNERYLFRGRDVEIGPNGTTFGDVTIDQVELGFANVRLAEGPFSAGSSAQTLRCAVKTADSSDVSGVDWRLIYGDGSTSKSSVVVSKLDDNGNTIGSYEVKLYSNLDIKVSDFRVDNDTKTWSRKFSYDKNGIQFEIEQNVKIGNKTSDEQYYEISYQFKNTSTNKLSINFMYNCDTAYSENDLCEGYYINNQQVGNTVLYSNDSNDADNANEYIKYGIPSSFSIFNKDNALQFTEKINIDETNKPDSLVLGRWNAIDKWNNYSASNINSILGKSTTNMDLAFSMIWSNRKIDAGGTETFGLKQGMAASATDSNVSAVPVTLNTDRLTRHDTYNPLWVQSGANKGEDMQRDELRYNRITRKCN